MFERIMVAIDEADPATPAIGVGAELARVLGARLALVHVVDPAPAANPEAGLPAAELLEEVRQTDSELLRAARSKLGPDLATDAQPLVPGEPVQQTQYKEIKP
jgi:nucleotide-binding universal stress UspA family protein